MGNFQLQVLYVWNKIFRQAKIYGVTTPLLRRRCILQILCSVSIEFDKLQLNVFLAYYAAIVLISRITVRRSCPSVRLSP